MQYLDDAKAIWRDYVPPSGQADSVQGELLLAVEKLRDEAIRNGNINWDEGFELLCAYLEQHLVDSAVYSDVNLRNTRAAIERVRDLEDPCIDDEVYDLLSDRVVEYFRHYGSVPHVRNPKLNR